MWVCVVWCGVKCQPSNSNERSFLLFQLPWPFSIPPSPILISIQNTLQSNPIQSNPTQPNPISISISWFCNTATLLFSYPQYSLHFQFYNTRYPFISFLLAYVHPFNMCVPYWLPFTSSPGVKVHDCFFVLSSKNTVKEGIWLIEGVFSNLKVSF